MSPYPCLWFDGQAKAAADYYCQIFPNSRLISANEVVIVFELKGQKFMGLNGGAQFTHSPAVSFVVECDTQAEIDHYWEELGKEGMYQQCGWLQDKFGISWQIIPTVLHQLVADPEKAPRVFAAFMQMQKFDIQTLLDA